MPRRYEAIRDKLKKEGLEEKVAKETAAKIYYATRRKGEPKLHRRKK